MIQKKVCLLGGFAVGKTSLVSRFVTSIFSEKYLTTVGVKVDKKLVSVNGQDVTLMLWDIYGEDEFQTVQPSYLRGASGYLVRPRFFDLGAIRDYSAAPEAAFFVDDVWISAHCRARKLVLPGRRTNFSSLADNRFFNASSLGRINCTGPDASRNNTIMLQYFADRWRVRQSVQS